jgi:uncharacterized protein (TIGR02145 family)
VWAKAITAYGCVDSVATTVTQVLPPAITLASGNDSQTIDLGDAITQIQYTTANASGATATGLPDGVSGAWASNVYTISGTPTSEGTYNYTVTTTNDKGCANASATSKIIVTVPLPPNSIGNTWSCGSQIWSGALRNPAGCSSTASLSTSSPPPAQYRDYSPTYGYYYNWTCVNAYASTLCPTPWRVPNPSDLNVLIACAGGNTSDGAVYMKNAWGFNGRAREDVIEGLNDSGRCWSSNSDGSNANSLFYGPNTLYPSMQTIAFGLQVRCVLNTP